MKLSQLASKPQLVQITLDDEDTVAVYGEPLEFWTWDRQPLETFMKLAVGASKDPATVLGIASSLILDESGKKVIDGDVTLPSNVMIRAIAKVTDALGK